jgi:glycerol-3-phosphate dehydrogenase (NAD(P)+)
MLRTITILGDGSWGTTLAIHLSQKGFSIRLWGAFSQNIRRIQCDQENKKFLPGIPIPLNVVATADLANAIQIGELIILAIPSRFLIPVLRKIHKQNLSGKVFLSVIKGIDDASLQRMSQIILRELGPIKLAVLSGPTIALEIARGIPSTAVVSAHDMRIAKKIQNLLNSERFRIYVNPDMTGVELGGSLKNIIAIACGLCDGLGFGNNAKAAILTRGLVEMSRLGKALGAKQKTFTGLAGLGDLVTTCVSPQSRNRFVGEQLGKGKNIRQIVSHMAMVAEGVTTAKAVYRLSQKLKIPMPITTEIYKIIYKNKSPQKAVADLMTRKIKAE